MPLTRANITVASRIMLPTYVGLATAHGLVYLFDPLHRLQYSHSLDFARTLMAGSMRPWGVVFLGIAGVLYGARRRGSTQAYLVGLSISACTWLLWAVIYTVAIFTDSRSSVLAPVAPLVFLIAAIATTRSLLTRER